MGKTYKWAPWRKVAGTDGDQNAEKSDPSAIIISDSSSTGGLREDSVSKFADGEQHLQPPPQTNLDNMYPPTKNDAFSHTPESAEPLPAVSEHTGYWNLQDSGLNQNLDSTLVESKAHTQAHLDQEGHSKIPPVEELNSYPDRNRARRKLMDTFVRLTDERQHVLPLRLQLHDLRASLRFKRAALNSQDAQLIQKMRVLFSKNGSMEIKSLLNDFTALLEARDELQPEEDDYDKLEDDLIRKEWELQEAELRIYGGGTTGQNSNIGEEELAILEETFEDTESTLSTHSGPAENSQQINNYLSRKGDANIVRERIDDLRAERAQLIEEEIMRARIGMILDEHSRAFLAEFDANHEALQQELTQIEGDILRLKEALVDYDGILFSSDQFDGSPWEIVDDRTSDLVQRLSLEAGSGFGFSDDDPIIREPLLLPVPPVEERPKPVFSDSSADISKGVSSTANHINEWLLHRLRISLHEVHHFISIGNIQRLNLSQDRIKDLVLEWWFKDQSADVFLSARKSAAQSANLSMQTTPGQIQTRETKSESDFPVLRETVLLARRDKSPLLHNSDSALPVQGFKAQSAKIKPTRLF